MDNSKKMKKPPRLVGGFSEKNWIWVFIGMVNGPGLRQGGQGSASDFGFSDIGSGYVSVAIDRTKMRLKRAVSKDGAIGFAPLLVKLTGP